MRSNVFLIKDFWLGWSTAVQLVTILKLVYNGNVKWNFCWYKKWIHYQEVRYVQYLNIRQ